MQRWTVTCCALLSLAAAHLCPDGGTCPQGHTCCSGPAGGPRCCRLDQSFRMIKTFLAEDEDVVCPDQTRCPAEFSCLKTASRFLCCPLPQGVACPDGRHCCPDGRRCSADGRSCVDEDAAATVVCKDGVSECPDGSTCCETPEGSWGCCPLPNAVCCSDKMHCCPAGSTCDLKQSKCLSLTGRETPMWAKLPARTREDWEDRGDRTRGDWTTGNWTREDWADRKGVAAAGKLTSQKVPERTTTRVPPPERDEVSTAGHDVQCDQSTTCPDGSTCCRTKEGGWACCPLPQAVCCKDFLHCCPSGKRCNLVDLTCDDGLGAEPWVEKVPAVRRGEVVQCDETAACPDGSTCCTTEGGGWACCPLPQAVCCDDHETCCPSGSTCNLATSTCDGALGSTPMRRKIPALTTGTPAGEEGHQGGGAEDGGAEGEPQCTCPDQTTCCPMKVPRTVGCCPLPHAVCCSDQQHCCPGGFTCTESGACQRRSGFHWRLLGWRNRPPTV